MCAHVCACMSVHACMFVCIAFCMCSQMCVSGLCAHLCVSVHELTNVSVHTCACLCVHTRVCACTQIYVHMCVCVHVSLHACMHVHVCTSLCECGRVFTHVSVHACLCAHLCASVCACVFGMRSAAPEAAGWGSPWPCWSEVGRGGGCPSATASLCTHTRWESHGAAAGRSRRARTACGSSSCICRSRGPWCCAHTRTAGCPHARSTGWRAGCTCTWGDMEGARHQ